MSDEMMRNLERELSKLSPAGLPEGLAARLRDEPGDEALTLGDRVLAGFSACGAVAAMVVVAVGIAVASGPEMPGKTEGAAAAQREMAREYQRLMAMR